MFWSYKIKIRNNAEKKIIIYWHHISNSIYLCQGLITSSILGRERPARHEGLYNDNMCPNLHPVIFDDRIWGSWIRFWRVNKNIEHVHSKPPLNAARVQRRWWLPGCLSARNRWGVCAHAITARHVDLLPPNASESPRYSRQCVISFFLFVALVVCVRTQHALNCTLLSAWLLLLNVLRTDTAVVRFYAAKTYVYPSIYVHSLD